MSENLNDAPAPEPTTKFKVRDGFVVHFADGRDPVEGPAEVDLTEAEAVKFAVQVEEIAAEDPKAKKAAAGAGN